jgi:mRNA interferase RelE/StbE
VAETETFQKRIAKTEFKKIYSKISTYIYPQLQKNPFYGPNIKKLKGEYESFYRYRIGNYRLFYQVDKNQITVFIITLLHRKDSY